MYKQIIGKNKVEALNCIILALVISHNYILNIFRQVTGIDNLFVIYIVSLTILSFFINKFKIEKRYVYLQLILISFILYKILFNGINDINMQYLMFFICYSICGGYIILNSYNSKERIDLLIKVILVIFTFGIPIFNSINYTLYSKQDLMVISYSLLPIFFVAISCIIGTPIMLNKKYFLFSIINIIVYGNYLIEYGSRGTLVAIVVYLLILISIKIKNYKVKLIYIIIVTVIMLLVISNIINILILINNWMDNYGIKSEAITKTIWSYNINRDITSSRSTIYIIAKNLIKENLLLGMGIGGFEKIMGYYPHNIFYQVALEWGIIILILLIVFICYIVKKYVISKKIENNNKYIVILLLLLSIPQLMFSSTYWNNMCFWMLITVGVVNINKK